MGSYHSHAEHTHPDNSVNERTAGLQFNRSRRRTGGGGSVPARIQNIPFARIIRTLDTLYGNCAAVARPSQLFSIALSSPRLRKHRFIFLFRGIFPLYATLLLESAVAE